MTKVYTAPERSLKETLEDLGSAESVNWRVHVFIGLPFILSAVILEQARFGGSVAAWLLYGLIFWLLTVLIIEGLFLVSKKRKWKKSNSALVIFLLALAGLIRGFFIYISGAQLGWIPETDLLYRLLVGPIFVVSAVATINVIVSNYLRDSRLNTELQYRQFELGFFEANLQQQIDQLREGLLDKVNNQLRPELRKIFRKLGQAKTKVEMSEAVALLLSVVDQTVRPLSRDLTLSRSIQRPNSAKPNLNPFTLKFPRRVALGSMIPLPLATLLFLLLGYPSLAVLSDPVSALGQIVAVVAVNIGLFALLKFLTSKSAFDPLVGLLIVSALGLVASILTLQLSQLVGSNLSEQAAIPTIVFSQAMLVTLYAYQLVKIQVLVAQEELQAVVTKLELVTSGLRQEAWVMQRNIATVLHGPVQAAMYSAALRLSQAKRPSDKLTASIKAEINAAIARLSSPDFLEGENVATVLRQIQELWDGLANISIEVDSSLMQELKKQPIPSQCVIEIAREGVSNAIKHGKAKEISISIKLQNPQMLRVSVANDGLTPDSSSEYGVGTALLNELSHSWEILSRDNQTELVAMVSLAKRD